MDTRLNLSFVHRDGSEVLRDPRSGNVLAEILLKAVGGDLLPVIASFSSPWPLGK